MNVKNILEFQRQLACNNNREWFTENKAWYQECHAELLDFIGQWTNAMADIDPAVAGLNPKDCIWRIYRDVRFSHDKRPYKEWFGLWLAQKGGKKSPYGGYYLHFQPGQCMFAGGVWGPEPDLLKALRQSVYDNYDELEDIFANPLVNKYFMDFSHDDMLKRVPAPYSADWEHADWLRHKMYTFDFPLTDKQMCAPNLLEQVLDLCRAARPLNDFLNYTVEEIYG